MVLVQLKEASSLPRQDEHETPETLFQNVDLNIDETQARQCFHTTGPGRPPRSPLGLFRVVHEPIAKEIIPVDEPGIHGTRLSAFNYKNVQRPIFPLDPGLLGVSELRKRITGT